MCAHVCTSNGSEISKRRANPHVRLKFSERRASERAEVTRRTDRSESTRGRAGILRDQELLQDSHIGTALALSKIYRDRSDGLSRSGRTLLLSLQRLQDSREFADLRLQVG